MRRSRLSATKQQDDPPGRCGVLNNEKSEQKKKREFVSLSTFALWKRKVTERKHTENHLSKNPELLDAPDWPNVLFILNVY